MTELLKTLFLLVWGGYMLVLSIWIILEKRSPQATISWIFALFWLPVVGWLVYYFFGPRKLKRSNMVRIESRNVLAHYRNYLQEQLAKALKRYPHLKIDEQGIKNIDLFTYNKIVGGVDGFKLPYLIPPDARQISRMIYESTGLPISVAREYDLLVGGKVALKAIFKAIKEAKHTIHLEYYIYEPDATGIELRDLLIEKAREGVKVRLLLDWLGSRKINHTFMADLLDAGGELDFFHKGEFRRFRPLLNMRSHRKIVVCDGVVGFTGGVNITDAGDIRKDMNAYHDLHLRIEGPAAYWLDEVFLEDWYYTTHKIPHDIPAPVSFDDVDVEQVKQVQIIASGPDTPDAPIWRAKLMAINVAQQRVWLTTPYFVPDEPAVFALTTAALRGVDVRLMVPSMSDSIITTLAARSWYAELLRAGVRIWEYGPTRMIHSKSLVIDESYSFVGTDNFDNRSFRLNFEVTVLNYERSGALELAKQFESDVSEAKELLSSDLEVRWWRRLPEDVARLGAPLL